MARLACLQWGRALGAGRGPAPAVWGCRTRHRAGACPGPSQGRGRCLASDGGLPSYGGGPGEEPGRPTITPWARTVISGMDMMRTPKYNKGLAFTEEERDRFHMRGLLPPALLSQEVRVDRVMINLRGMDSNLAKHQYLMSLADRNEQLFYQVLMKHIEELKPIVHVPTVGMACQKYGIMFRGVQRGLWISIKDRGRIHSILKNWPEQEVQAIVVTDGERVLGLGDLGVQGMGIAVSKTAMYTACGGIHPAQTLPVCIDVGTDNEELLSSPFYVGLRHRRVRGEAYEELMEEFMDAVKQRFGSSCMVHLEDFNFNNSVKLLSQYRGVSPIFIDEIQGTAAVALAAIKAALPLAGGSLEDHTYLLAGAGETGASIANLLASAIARSTGITLLAARQRIWLHDAHGLVVRSRAENIEDHKLPYAHEHFECPSLLESVKALKPSVLIGSTTRRSNSGKSFTRFTRDILTEMAELNESPVVLALSSPQSECSADDAYRYSDGRCIFASGGASSVAPVVQRGKVYLPSTAHTAYVYPGVTLGAMASGSLKLKDEMFLAAADALAHLVSDEDREARKVLPPFSQIHHISATIAAAVADKAYEMDLATVWPRPDNLYEHIRRSMYEASYQDMR